MDGVIWDGWFNFINRSVIHKYEYLGLQIYHQSSLQCLSYRYHIPKVS